MKIIKQQKIGAKKATTYKFLGIIAAGNDKKKNPHCFSNTKPLATLPNSRVGTIMTDNFVTLIIVISFNKYIT